jgi:hypothetical protein
MKGDSGSACGSILGYDGGSVPLVIPQVIKKVLFLLGVSWEALLVVGNFTHFKLLVCSTLQIQMRRRFKYEIIMKLTVNAGIIFFRNWYFYELQLNRKLILHNECTFAWFYHTFVH